MAKSKTMFVVVVLAWVPRLAWGLQLFPQSRSVQRREVCVGGAIASGVAGVPPPTVAAFVGDERDTTRAPLVDVPLRRLKLPVGGFGRDYVLVAIEMPGGATEEFILDTGLSLELVTPALRERLHLAKGQSIEGATAGGVGEYELVELSGASVGGVELPPLHATIADFPMEHIDPKHPDVTGMLGLEFTRLFDVDVDCRKGRLRLWRVGDGAAAARRDGLVEVPGWFYGRGLAIRVAGRQTPGAPRQPFFGIVDSGASNSVLTTQAAILAGLTPERLEEIHAKATPRNSILGFGVAGRPTKMPLVNLQLDLCGDLDETNGAFRTAARLPDDLRVAVGDLPVFKDLLGESLGSCAALLGIDVWAQGRTLFTGGDSSKAGPSPIFWSGASA